MLTRYRPHLQEAKDYANWLKDERRFSNREVENLAIRELPKRTTMSQTVMSIGDDIAVLNSLEGVQTVKQIQLVDVLHLPRAGGVVKALRARGYPARIYVSDLPEAIGSDEGNSFRNSECIWIGADIVPHQVIQAIKIVICIWPHLKYLHLSSDGAGPDDTHLQLFFGGSTNTAHVYGLRGWSRTELEALPDEPSYSQWHDLIRGHYGR